MLVPRDLGLGCWYLGFWYLEVGFWCIEVRCRYMEMGVLVSRDEVLIPGGQGMPNTKYDNNSLCMLLTNLVNAKYSENSLILDIVVQLCLLVSVVNVWVIFNDTLCNSFLW